MSEQTLSVVSFEEWCKAEGVTAVHPKVRTNMNGYPFMTVLRGSDAENIYFSKTAGEDLVEDEIIPNPKGLRVAETVNADGEMRLKLTWGGGEYISIIEFFS